MPTGKISGIVKRDGYGFLESETEPRIFFHQRWLEGVRFRELRVGDEVSFELDKGPRGPRAKRISVINREVGKESNGSAVRQGFTAESGRPGARRVTLAPRSERNTGWRDKIRSLFRD